MAFFLHQDNNKELHRRLPWWYFFGLTPLPKAAHHRAVMRVGCCTLQSEVLCCHQLTRSKKSALSTLNVIEKKRFLQSLSRFLRTWVWTMFSLVCQVTVWEQDSKVLQLPRPSVCHQTVWLSLFKASIRIMGTFKSKLDETSSWKLCTQCFDTDVH